MTEDEEAQGVAAIHEVIAAHTPVEGALLTGWVVVAEWSHPDGGYSLSTVYSDYLPPWKRDGMLEHGKSVMYEDDE